MIRQFVKEEEGLSAAEYAIICASVNHRGYDLHDSIATAIGNATTVLNS